MDADKPEILIGRKPVIDALESHKPLTSIWIDRSLRGPEEIKIRQLAREQAIPLKRIGREILNKKTKSNHQGVIAYTSPIRFVDVEAVLNWAYEKGETPLLLYLDRIQDVGNLGSIIRTAEVMGVHAIVVPAQKMAPINDQVVKISTGAVHKISICRINNVLEYLKLIQQYGIKILASSLSATQSIDQLDLTVPLCLIVGSEDTGISTEIEDRSNELFIIPQLGETESLNASVATGIMLYEVQRQRGCRQSSIF